LDAFNSDYFLDSLAPFSASGKFCADPDADNIWISSIRFDSGVLSKKHFSMSLKGTFQRHRLEWLCALGHDIQTNKFAFKSISTNKNISLWSLYVLDHPDLSINVNARR
jgi:hypothetical protein